MEPLATTVQFGVGSSELDDDATQALDRFGRALSRGHSHAIAIHGRASEKASLEQNLDLAERRAQVVSRYLAKFGLEGFRLAVLGSESAPDDQRGRRCELEAL